MSLEVRRLIYKQDKKGDYNNKLKLLVVEIDLSNSIQKYFIHTLISLDFETAYSRYEALESIQKFGAVKPIEEAIGGELYMRYFNQNELEGEDDEAQGVNNVLFLDAYLSKDIKLNIGGYINKVLASKDEMAIKEIREMEYGIYFF